MADANIKKVTILKEDLPAIDSTNFTYNVRYRIVSDDKNRTSHWSKIYNIDASQTYTGTPTIPAVTYSYVKENTTDGLGGIIKTIRLTWTAPTQFVVNSFDIYLKRCSTVACTESYEYVGTTANPTFTAFKTGTETHFKFLVQVPTYPKVVTPTAQLFETVSINI